VLVLGAGAFAAWYVEGAPARADLLRRLTGNDHETTSPFAAVRWLGPSPEVLVPGLEGWHRVVAIEGVRVGLLVELCKQTAGPLWRKRLDEDLVEVLTRSLGHPPGKTVSLQLESVATGAPVAVTAPLTEENRRAVWAARYGSPFDGLRFRGETAEVLMGGRWGELVSVDGIPAQRLVAACREAFGTVWAGMFEVDLVRALTELTGRSPGPEVRVEILDPERGPVTATARLRFENTMRDQR
jgi:hypothetical protein